MNNENVAKIKVVGVGGGGNNTIHSMIKDSVQNVEFIILNTDAQVVNSSPCEKKLVLGKDKDGLGAGAKPEEGRVAALESENEIKELLNGADMVIIAAGMGGGTGTGAAPIVADVAKSMGALTVGIVTTPFAFEGTARRMNANNGISELRKNVDSIIVVSNDKLLEQYGEISLKDSFKYADTTLKATVRTITDLIVNKALINLDFADVTTTMKNKGTALIGIGTSTGEDRSIKAATHAITSPILEASIRGATNAIINVTGGDITLSEADKAVQTIKHAAGADLNIIFGVSIDEGLGNKIQVSVIATGLDENADTLSEEELKQEAAKAVESLDVEFENEKTRELLIEDPLPTEEKLVIDNASDSNSDDEDNDLPDFLR